MSKRFADTALSREKWFRLLSPAHKAAWRFLSDDCDNAGVWSIDQTILDLYVGVPIVLDDFLEIVNSGKERIRRLDGDLLYFVGFCHFQYGIKKPLSPACKPHEPIIARLKALGLLKEYLDFFDTLTEGLANPTGKGKGYGNGEGNGKGSEEGGAGETSAPPVPPENRPPAAPTPPQAPRLPPDEVQVLIAEAKTNWRRILEKSNMLPTIIGEEDLLIGKNILDPKRGAEAVRLAMLGMEHEPKGDNYKPSRYVYLTRLFDPEKFLYFVGLGRQAQQWFDEKASNESQKTEAATPAVVDRRTGEVVEEAEGPPDPENLAQAQRITQMLKGRKMPTADWVAEPDLEERQRFLKAQAADMERKGIA
jgi:hypothetical protein